MSDALSPVERDRVETRRNQGPDSFVRIWQDGDWTVLHVRAGGVETTASLREHDAWPLALALSPALSEAYRQRGLDAADRQHALWQFTSCNLANAELLRKVADEWDCSGSCDKFHTEWDTGATICSEDDKDGCRAAEAESLRDLAKAIDTLTALRSPAQGGVEGERDFLFAENQRLLDALENVDADLRLLHRAVKESDPRGEIIVRISDVLEYISARLSRSGEMRNG